MRACLHAISTKDKYEKKFILGLLYDISNSPIFIKIMKEIPWKEGMGRLIDFGFIDEPVCVSFIMTNLYRVRIIIKVIKWNIGYCNQKLSYDDDVERSDLRSSSMNINSFNKIIECPVRQDRMVRCWCTFTH